MNKFKIKPIVTPVENRLTEADLIPENIGRIVSQVGYHYHDIVAQYVLGLFNEKYVLISRNWTTELIPFGYQATYFRLEPENAFKITFGE